MKNSDPSPRAILLSWIGTLIGLDTIHFVLALGLRNLSLTDALSDTWIYAFNLAMLSGALFLYMYYRRKRKIGRS